MLQIRQKDVYLGELIEIASRRLADRPKVPEDLMGLFGEVVADQLHADRVEGYLSGKKHQIATGDGLGIGANGPGGLIGADDGSTHDAVSSV
jgi:hypothetical protein